MLGRRRRRRANSGPTLGRVLWEVTWHAIHIIFLNYITCSIGWTSHPSRRTRGGRSVICAPQLDQLINTEGTFHMMKWLINCILFIRDKPHGSRNVHMQLPGFSCSRVPLPRLSVHRVNAVPTSETMTRCWLNVSPLSQVPDE